MNASLVASVVFLKIADFARRPASEQARLKAQLEAVVAVTAAEIAPASRIVLEASDGIAVVVLRNPLGALELGRRALGAAAAGLPLSVGINHGALQLAGQEGAHGMTGDAIAVAASLAEYAQTDCLLASRTFRDAVAEARPGREALLAHAGSFHDAGLRTHELFAPDEHAVARRARRYAAAGLVVVVALAGAGLSLRLSDAGPQPFMAALDKHPYFRGLVQRVGY